MINLMFRSDLLYMSFKGGSKNEVIQDIMWDRSNVRTFKPDFDAVFDLEYDEVELPF